jgi:2-dehydro-3-deoxyphosphogalactonate aldolase
MISTDGLLTAGAPPIVAILRGLRPEEAVDIGRALVDAGIRLIEVPLNSPDPFASIARLQAAFGDRAMIGAGTVLDTAAVERLAATGARLMVTPNTDPEVIACGLAHGLEVVPGFLTPSEAFAAIKAGARRLKLFPASEQSAGYLRALLDVVPRDVRIWAVGGVTPENAAGWLAAGAEGVAVWTALYQSGASPEDVGARAKALATAVAHR